MAPSPSPISRLKPPTTTKKVKTGCRTCKTRRVKCDEGRPSCHRCVSTGRICDGYGIWGGGGHGSSHQALVPRSTAVTLPSRIRHQQWVLSPDQETCFQWFRCRTQLKLPIPFISPFWQTLVLQALAVEPAILHAVLALASAHQNETLEQGRSQELCVPLHCQQPFMLHEYGKAIRSLRPHFSGQGSKSVQVALIACTLFTFFENLLGRYTAANTHLHSGLRLLSEVYVPSKPRGYVDDWIIETFARLHVQAALLGQGLLELCPRLPVYPTSPTPRTFASASEAAHFINRILLDALYLRDQCALSNKPARGKTFAASVETGLQRLQAELDTWLAAYDYTASDPACNTVISPEDAFYLKVLRGYHTVTGIVVRTCTPHPRETLYDSCTAEFLHLVEQMVAIWQAHIVRPVWHHSPWADGTRRISHSVGDKGWVPLLYFVAVKCRIHRVRLQAIKLLSQTIHKEGIWDSRLALAIAKEVVRIEEGDDHQDSDDNFSFISIPTEQDITLPSLPDHLRLYNIQVGLPQHSKGVLTLEYEQRFEDADVSLRKKRCYDLKTGSWKDGVDKPRSTLANSALDLHAAKNLQ
ncbi:hypothetical protein F4808DRAFT_3919 [Astrocystis sublimbata]|nr:hypothetical protein F4808DRAFT_3919 [Astrocystis sublimbata]